ncbi:hypothetical protein TrispH2_006922 [Trichoplax sp. H2]|nr:hypothetical protein TrispH2_006922 [Trichoplax sp. H2]|eukprot:RDD41280.1 hypothetical protein TrispH2_006922 [Trichoplax sp. H2]
MEYDSGIQSIDYQTNDNVAPSVENSGENHYKKMKPDSLRKILHGIKFQLALQILAAIRADLRDIHFILSSESKEAHNLDDLVIDYGRRIVFVQAKHTAKTDDTDSRSSNITSTSKDSKRISDAGKSYSKKDFFLKKANKVCLADFFDTWMKFKLKKEPWNKILSDNMKDIRCMLFTNRNIEDGDEYLDDADFDPDDEFTFEDFNTKTKKFKQGETREEFKRSIQAYSETAKKYSNMKVIECDPEGNTLTISKDENSKKRTKVDEEAAIKEAALKLSKKLMNINRDSKEIRLTPPDISFKALALVKLAISDDSFRDLLIPHMDKKLNNPREVFDQFKKVINIKDELNCSAILCNAMEDEINQFLNEFIFKYEQPNCSMLEEIIVDQLKLRTIIGQQELFNAVYKIMLDWFSKTDVTSVSGKEIRTIMNAEIGDRLRYKLYHFTMDFLKIFDEYPIMNNLKVEDLLKFLQGTGKPSVALVTGIGIKARVYQTVKSLKSYTQKEEIADDKWIFVEIDKLSLTRRTHYLNLLQPIVKEANDSKKKLVLLLKDKQKRDLDISFHTDDDNNDNTLSLPESMVVPSGKNDQTTVEGNQNLEEGGSTSINIKGLSGNQIKSVYKTDENKYIDLGGKFYQLSRLIKDTSCSLFSFLSDLDNVDLIRNRLKAERPKSDRGLKMNIYVPNDVIEGVPIYDLRNLLTTAKANLFIFKNNTNEKQLKDQLEKWFNRREVRFQVYEKVKQETDWSEKESVRYIFLRNISDIDFSEKKFRDKCFIYIGGSESLKEKNIIYINLKCRDSTCSSVIIESNPSKLNFSSPLEYDFNKNLGQLTNSEKDVFQFYNFSILLADAGHGKTAFCLNERYKWKEYEDEISWRIFISLPKIQLSSSPKLSSIFTSEATGHEWEDWQLEIIQKDMEETGKVFLLLDAFDEMKDQDQINNLRLWLDIIPSSTSILITARPYAIKDIKLSKNHQFGKYFQLQQYSKKQLKIYISRYIEKIRNKMNGDKGLQPNQNEIVMEVWNNLKGNKKVTSTLGIPLESYIYCEILENQLREWLSKSISLKNIKSILSKHSSDSTVKLFQQFFKEKLTLYFKRHLKFDNLKIIKSSSYILGTSFTNTLSAYAFKQAFNLKDDLFIDKCFDKIQYIDEITKELPNTGLILNVDNSEPNLQFIHDTYQDYLAAVFLIKDILLTDDLPDTIKECITKRLYDPNYRLFFRFAAQVSIGEEPILPKLDKKRKIVIFRLWKLLTEKVDIMGAGSRRLFYDCLHEYTKDQREKLKSYLAGNEWATELIEFIDEYRVIRAEDSERNSQNDQNENENEEVEKFTLLLDNSDPTLTNKKMEITEPKSTAIRIELLQNKNYVYSYTSSILQECNAEDVALKFEEVTEDDLESYKYWDIDGGFSAMALLGKAFTQKLADYFIFKLDRDPEWRFQEAFQAIELLHDKLRRLVRTDSEKAMNACLSVILCLIKNFNAPKVTIDDNLRKRVRKLLQRAHKNIFQNFFQLKTKISDMYQLDSKNLLSMLLSQRCLSTRFKPIITILQSLFWIALELEFAVTVEENDKIIFSKIEIFHLSVKIPKDGNNAIESIYMALQNYLIEKLKKESGNKLKELFTTKEEIWQFLLDSCGEKIVNLALPLLKDQEGNIRCEFITEFISDGEKAAALYKFLHRNKLMTEEIANLLLTKCELYTTESARGDFWPAYGGIKAVAYVGEFFNERFASFLRIRAGMWGNINVNVEHSNLLLAVRALQKIEKTLDSRIDDNYFHQKALESVNNCWNELPKHWTEEALSRIKPF